jgi:hypothetical protein
VKFILECDLGKTDLDEDTVRANPDELMVNVVLWTDGTATYGPDCLTVGSWRLE